MQEVQKASLQVRWMNGTENEVLIHQIKIINERNV